VLVRGVYLHVAVVAWVLPLTGTPGNLIKGLFFDVTNGREAGRSGHRWDTYNEPVWGA
jgi:hypothetical protein